MFWFSFFFFNDTATTEIYTLSLHDALPILVYPVTAPTKIVRGESIDDALMVSGDGEGLVDVAGVGLLSGDRKSTRLNSSHANISYAVFCLKKKTHDVARCWSVRDGVGRSHS